MKFVVTAGPTREPIDPVRFLSNRSSGKMGYAIAEAARDAGHDVVLISGPVCLPAPKKIRIEQVNTSDEMFAATRRATRDCNVLVMCAAVADYKPRRVAKQKIKKGTRALRLDLIPTRDTLSTIARASRKFFVVGFAAETENVEANAQKKLRAKNCDMIVANDVSRRDSGMETDQNAVTIFARDGFSKKISRAPKKIIAQRLVKIIAKVVEKSLTKKT